MHMKRTEALNLALRVILEFGVVVGLGYWGFTTGSNTAAQIALGIGAPILLFGFWGAVDFHQARYGEQLRLVQELAISGLAAVALWASGARAFGAALAALSVIYHASVHLSGERLLKRGRGASTSTAQEQADGKSGS
jgi:Protein of unknown function (DUF2568)